MHLTFRTSSIAAALLGACGEPDAGSATDTTATSASADTGPASADTGATAPATDTTAPDATGDPQSTGLDPTTGAATSDATTSDATTGAAAGCADLPLCDDFEDVAAGGPPDPAVWTIASPNCMGTGKLAVADDQAHSGGQSLRVDGGGGYCDHVFIANTAAIAGLGPVVHGRFWLRLEAALGQGHVTFLTLRDAADGGKDLRMGGQSQILMYNRESDDATLPALSPAGIAQSVAPTPMQWTCIEFSVDQGAGHVTTWVDGAEVPGLAVDGEPTPDLDQQWLNKPDWKPDLEDLKFGWESYAGQTMTLYFDDIALAGDRIGCG